MAVNAYRSKVKRRLGIPEQDDQFDSDLDDFTLEAIANLYPIVQRELPLQEVTLPSDTNTIDLDNETFEVYIESLRRVHVNDDVGDTWTTTDEYTIHDRTVYLYGTLSSQTLVRLEGSGRYTNGNVPLELTQVIINWVMSEFYSLLTGDKRKYNIYTQTTGARAVDNLRDLSDYYLDRGNQLLADRATVRGQ